MKIYEDIISNKLMRCGTIRKLIKFGFKHLRHFKRSDLLKFVYRMHFIALLKVLIYVIVPEKIKSIFL
jgi:hypothetical protein